MANVASLASDALTAGNGILRLAPNLGPSFLSSAGPSPEVASGMITTRWG